METIKPQISNPFVNVGPCVHKFVKLVLTFIQTANHKGNEIVSLE